MSFREEPSVARTDLPPDIAFLRSTGVAERHLTQAAAAARRAGTDAATALLHAGLIDETFYYRALARALRRPFLDGPIPFGPGLRHPDCLVAGLAPLAPGACAEAVIAPRGPLIADLLSGRMPLRGFALTSPTHLREAVFAAMPGVVAAEALGRHRGGTEAGPALLILALSLAALACLHAAAPPLPALAVTLGLQGTVLALTAFRLAAPLLGPERVEAPPLPNAMLPVYTVLVPLYREAGVVNRLVKALAGLDYPALWSKCTTTVAGVAMSGDTRHRLRYTSRVQSVAVAFAFACVNTGRWASLKSFGRCTGARKASGGLSRPIWSSHGSCHAFREH